MFYSFYYLMSQCGFLIGSGTELIGLALNEPLRPWFVMLPTAAALSAILAIIGMANVKYFFNTYADTLK